MTVAPRTGPGHRSGMNQHVEPAFGERAVTGHLDRQWTGQVSRQRGADGAGDFLRHRVVPSGGTDLQVRHADAGAGRIAPVGRGEGLPRLVDPGNHAVAVQQRDLYADVGPDAAALRPSPSAPGLARVRRREHGARGRRPRGQGRVHGRVDGHQAADAGHAQHPQDDSTGHDQPQLRAADHGALISPRHGIGARVIAGDRGGHVHDQCLSAPVDDRQQFLADRPGIGYVDILRQRHQGLPPGPSHGVAVLRSHRHPGVPSDSLMTSSLCTSKAAGTRAKAAVRSSHDCPCHRGLEQRGPCAPSSGLRSLFAYTHRFSTLRCRLRAWIAGRGLNFWNRIKRLRLGPDQESPWRSGTLGLRTSELRLC